IVGLVSMNQVVVDATGLDGVAVGDEVVLIGEQDGVPMDAAERCRHGTSPYEVCTALHPSLPRVLLGASRAATGRIPRAT
ncbi:MAG: Alanine racemase, C-terminal domain, partial [Planctomycetota bacterium]